MTVNLSLLGGAGWQFSDNNGVPLSGGLLYTYAAGTTTPQTTYTSNTGLTFNANPIVLDSAGRVSGEIWLTDAVSYKFVLKTSAGVTIGTYDNVTGNSSGIYAAFAASSGSSLVGFIQSGTGAVATTVQAKLRESVSVSDFGGSLSVAINSIGATYKTLLVDSAIVMSTNVTVPSNVSLEIPEGGSITTTGYTLTINGNFSAGLYQVFFGSGSVVGLLNSCVVWFGENTTPGVTNMTSAFVAAHSAIREDGGELILPVGISLFSSTLTFNKRITVTGVSSVSTSTTTNSPGTTLLKSSSLNGTGVIAGGANIFLKDFTVRGQAGNGGDGIQFSNHAASGENLTVQLMGRDGIRVGDDIGTNVNSWGLTNINVTSNGRYGIYVHDGSGGAAQTTAGTAIRVEALNNVSDGVRVGNSYAGTYLGLTLETNGGYGINFTSDSRDNTLLAGDSEEANVSGAVYNAGTGNMIFGPNYGTLVDAGIDTININRAKTKLMGPLTVNIPAAGTGLVTTFYKQYLLNAAYTSTVVNGAAINLFSVTMTAVAGLSASLQGTLYLSYHHVQGGDGTNRCFKAYAISANAVSTGLANITMTEIPEYSNVGGNTSNVMSHTFVSNVLTIINTNTQTTGTGMLFEWSFVGHGQSLTNVAVL
jgi:hypothetical protein